MRLTSDGAAVLMLDTKALEPGELRVSPGGESTLDGDVEPGLFTGVQRLEVRLEGGSSLLELSFLDLPKGLLVETGDAADEVVLRGGSYGKLVDLDLGDGDNTLALRLGVQIQGKLRVVTGAGADELTLRETAFVKKRARIDLGAGGSNVLVTEGASFGAALFVDTGNSSDVLRFEQGVSVAKRARLRLGDGNNNLFIRDDSSFGRLDVSSGFDGSILSFESGSSTPRARFDCDGGANSIGLITGASVDRLEVRGKTGAETLIISGGARVTKRLRARLEDGLNRLIYTSGAGLQGAVDYCGDGANILILNPLTVIAGTFKARFGDATNSFAATGAELHSSLSLIGGDGSDTFDFDATSVGKKVTLKLGAGTNSSTASGSDFGASVLIVGGKGDDDVDDVDWEDADVAGTFKFVSKGGEDTLLEPM